MKKIIYIVFALNLIWPVYLTAQKLDSTDHFKYWYYRQRLVDEFVIVGEAESLGEPSGLSLPALGASHIGNNDYLTLSWKDNPIQGLGRYIGVLATELALLYFNGESYEETQWELYCAMKAYERLDYNCEYLFYPHDSLNYPNGVFCRSDVPKNFTSELHPDFRTTNNYSQYVRSAYVSYIEDCVDKYAPEKALEFTFYPSSEEWEGMLTGFALLVKSLNGFPDEVIEYNDYNFIDEAINNTTQYITQLIMDDWVGKLNNDSVYKHGEEAKIYQGLYGLAKATDYIWNFHDHNPPNAPADVYGDMFEDKNPFLDGDFYSFLASFDTSLLVTANTVLAMLVQNQIPDSLILRYQKYCWNKFGDPYFDLIVVDSLPSIGYFLNQLFRDEYLTFIRYPTSLTTWDSVYIEGNRWVASTAYTLAAIGDSWYDAQEEDENITYESLVLYTDPINWTIFPLLNLYLHNKQNDADSIRRKLITQLQTAPCSGPHYLPNFDPSSTGVSGWRKHYRWDASLDAANNGQGSAKFPGIDYMIAYNLLWLDCFQKGMINNYFDISKYENLRDVEQNVIENYEKTVCFNYGYDASLTRGESRGGMSYYNRDLILTAPQITLEGEQGYGGGYTLELIPDRNVTYCDIEDYLIELLP